MRILQQCIYFPPEVGGLESHAYYLCRELVRQGDEVTMLTSRSRPDAPAVEVMEGVRVLRRWFPGKHPLGWTAHTLATFPTHLRLARDADILHAQTFASALPAIRARRKLGLPLVMTLHTSHFLRLARQAAWRPVLRRIIASCDWVLAASQEIRDVALELHAHPRAEALTNGVDTHLFRPGPPALVAGERRRLVVPRRLFAKNGVEYLVRAMPLLAREHDVEALLVGDGPEGGRLRALAHELGVADRVRFLGARPNAEMPGLLRSAELAVFPSLMEATSVAALEAMSCSVPVAASRVGGLPEIVDESVGALCEPADPAALAAAVGALLARSDLAALGAAARARVVAHWSLERLARRHREIYRTLLAERA
ncbi:MAG: glycosyltransferase family 4 protein [Gemmatimonadota bacterium]